MPQMTFVHNLSSTFDDTLCIYNLPNHMVLLVSNLSPVELSDSNLQVTGFSLEVDSIRSCVAIQEKEDAIQFVTLTENSDIYSHSFEKSEQSVVLLYHLENDPKTYRRQIKSHQVLGGSACLLLILEEKEDDMQHDGACSNLSWYEISSMKKIGEYNVQGNHQRILDMEPLNDGYDILSGRSLAVAVLLQSVTKATTSETYSSHIDILQGFLNTSHIIHKVHPVYHLPSSTESNEKLVLLPSLMNGKIESESFHTRYLYCQKEYMTIYEFKSKQNDIIAYVKMALEMEEYDHADQIITSCDKEELKSSFGSVHVTEAVLHKFKHLIQGPNLLSGEKKDAIKECLYRLTNGAVVDELVGVQNLLDASRFLRLRSVENDELGPVLRDYRMALSAMSMSISEATKCLSSKFTKDLRTEIDLLDKKSCALKTIERMITSDKNKVLIGSKVLSVQNPLDLFRLLLSEGAIKLAEIVREEYESSYIKGDDLYLSILHIPSDIDPLTYCGWIENVLFGKKIIPMHILNELILWCSNHANDFDAPSSFGILASILLLDTFKSGLDKLSLSSHESFSSYVPYSDDCHHSCKQTILDGNNVLTSVISRKLISAKAINAARKLGLEETSISLGSFDSLGGFPNFGKALIASILVPSLKDAPVSQEVKSHLQDLCDMYHISFDIAVEAYIRDACKSGSLLCLDMATELVAVCSVLEVKCRITLLFLRLSLLSAVKPDSLQDLARNAISWATNADLKSELEEAKRLLGIDGIVRRYCGNRACTLFRVSDPCHVSKLAGFICRNIDKAYLVHVISDVLFLCDAFTHLSASDCFLQILKRIVTSEKAYNGECLFVLKEALRADSKMAENVAIQLCIFCSNVMRECSSSNHAFSSTVLFSSACGSAIDTCLAMRSFSGTLPKTHISLFRTPSWDSLRQEFQRTFDLAEEFHIFISIDELRSGISHEDILERLVTGAVERCDMLLEEDHSASVRRKLKNVKRCCHLLYGDHPQLIASKWSKVIGLVSRNLANESDDAMCLLLLDASGILDDINEESTYQAIASVVLKFCQVASDAASSASIDKDDTAANRSMKSIISAGVLLEEHALLNGPSMLLSSTLFLHNLVDAATQMIFKFDCGVGELMESYKRALISHRRNLLRHNPSTSCVLLHPSWHTGDGLLLPPAEALHKCMSYCKMLLTSEVSTCQWNMNDLFRFLSDRGAHSLSLRLLQSASMTAVSSLHPTDHRHIFIHQGDQLQDILLLLAERSLGGSGNGNTNSKIDSQLAFSYLVSLPRKTSFNVYKRCLPSAMTRGDFDRLISLANVGIRAAGGTSPTFELYHAEISYGWINQSTFLNQCHDLSLKGRWWKILSHLKVPFDFSAFESHDIENDKISRIVQSLIIRASQSIYDASIVQMLVKDFCLSFGLDSKLPIQRHLEYLLSPSVQNDAQSADIRLDLLACETAVQTLLKQLPSALSRSSTLRKCLTTLERDDEDCSDYERIEMVLSLYQNELRGMLEGNVNLISTNSIFLNEEIDRIDRRQDALSILSSFYSGNNNIRRIPFPKCFLPLAPISGLEFKATTKTTFAGILGSHHGQNEAFFDPIAPLEEILDQSLCESTISALSPICLTLGVPSGYIHARALIKMFNSSRLLGGSPPPFESDLLPVLKRLKYAKDSAELAEFCSSYYDHDSLDRLNCLKYALNQALHASNEAEEALRSNNDLNREFLVSEEQTSLERVKRLTSLKESLDDIITIKSILDDEIKNTDNTHVHQLMRQIVKQVIDSLKNGLKLISPEILCERLLNEGSRIASQSCLNSAECLDVGSLKKVAFAIYKACVYLEDQYSHIDVDKIIRNLVRSWLVYGDEGSTLNGQSAHDIKSHPLKRIEGQYYYDKLSIDDDSTDLVLDLKSIGTVSSIWNDIDGNKVSTMTADEEQSIIDSNTERENSEYACARVTLRISFVMAFAINFHASDIDENTEPECYTKVPDQHSVGLTKLHAKYLLNIVFSKVSIDSFHKDITSEYLKFPERISTTSGRSDGRALTFAMRYRALRAASVLCPESILREVIREEIYVGEDNKCSIAQCCFGSFLAKEIEAIGLPLPHSDLVQLSCMHHPSYARTLWRHHGNQGYKQGRGRILLLMMELSLRADTKFDADLIHSILQEVIDSDLPRTQLLICEKIAYVHRVQEFFEALDGSLGTIVIKLVKKILANILLCTKKLKEDSEFQNFSRTLARIGNIIIYFMKSNLYLSELEVLIATMCQSALNVEIMSVRDDLFEVAFMIANRIKEEHLKEKAIQRVYSTAGDEAMKNKLARISGIPLFGKARHYSSSKNECLSKLMDIEDMKNQSLLRIFDAL